MGYIFSGLIFGIVTFLFFQYVRKPNQKKQIEKLRSRWGNPKNESFDFSRIRKYFDVVNKKGFHQLSQQTIDDIDFHELFEFIDRTTSKVGQQFLFKKIIQPSGKTVDDQKKLVDLFSTNQNLREDVQIELLKLSNTNAYFISSLLQDRWVERPRWFSLLIIDLASILILLLLSLVYPACLILLLIPLAINTLLHYWNKGNTLQFINSFPQLNLLIKVTKAISKKDKNFSDQEVEISVSELKSFQQKSSLISLDVSGGIQSELNQIGTYFTELIKGFFLIEVFTFFWVIEELQLKKSSILTLFNYVGNIDASISVVSLRSGELKTCQPEFISSTKELTAKEIYHPLIENCDKNDLTIKGNSILITGSNMSGKTTFLRTLTINSILSQTIYTCFADEFKTPVLKQFTSIRVDDSLFEGKSFYFQEVDTIGKLLGEVNSDSQNLFILDEVFKGTNTIERIAASKAILSFLNQRNNIVVVSTHDIELSDMLENEYDLYHFTETIENNELHFDHKIKPGQLKTRNAIKLLELSNYPGKIIQEAQTISTSLKSNQVFVK